LYFPWGCLFLLGGKRIQRSNDHCPVGGELIRSAKDALEGKIHAIEERSAAKLPMNARNMLLVRLNDDGSRLYRPEDLYLELLQACKNGYFQRYGVGTAQQSIRQEAIKELPAKGNRYKGKS
jgi:hypothetical protein